MKDHVENDPRAFYQAFRGRKAARKWYRRHKRFRLDFDTVPVHDEEMNGRAMSEPREEGAPGEE